MLDTLRRLANEASGFAYTPYSNQPVGTVVLLSDGSWLPGVRVENASFPLVIPALTAAYSTARCAGHDDLVAVVQSCPFQMCDSLFLSEALGTPWVMPEPDVMLRKGIDELPILSERLEIYLEAAKTVDDRVMLQLAEEVARRAHIPESGFPVGCVVTAEDGSFIPGCNVEHTDWTRGLCAERIALASARAYGHSSFRCIHLACPLEPNPASCGACRQVMFELATGVPIVMGRGANPPVTNTPEQLLPNGFRGETLRS